MAESPCETPGALTMGAYAGLMVSSVMESAASMVRIIFLFILISFFFVLVYFYCLWTCRLVQFP